MYAFQFLAIGMWSAYATVYFEELGIPVAAIGVLAAVPAAVAIVAAPGWGLVADRLGDMRGPYLVASILAAAAGVLLALVPEVPAVMGGILLLAAGVAGQSPLLDARTIQRLWPSRERFGQARVAGSIAFAGGSVLAGAIVGATETRALFGGYAVAMLGAGVAAVVLLGRPGSRPGEKRVANVGPLAALRLLREPALGLFFAGSCVTWTAAVGAMTFFSLRILELGGDAGMVGIGWAATALFEVPFMAFFGRLAQRVRVERLIVVGTGLFILRAALWTLVDTPWALIALTALGGSGYALVLVGTTSYVARRAPAQLAATAQALFGATTFSFGTIAGAVVAGAIAAGGGLWAVYPAAAVGAAAGAVMTWWAIGRGEAPAG